MVVVGTAFVISFLTFGVGMPVLLAGTTFLDAPVAARMVIKCACDLILILDRAFKHGGRFVAAKDIEEASKEYVEQPTIGPDTPAVPSSIKSRKDIVHAEVLQLIPVFHAKFYRGVRIATVKTGMEEIIKKYRWQPGEGAQHAIASASTLALKPSNDEDDIRELFELDSNPSSTDQLYELDVNRDGTGSLRGSNPNTTLHEVCNRL